MTNVERTNRIRSSSDAALWRDIVGEQNYAAMLSAIEDGAMVWVFASEEQIALDPDLTASEKIEARQILLANKSEFAGWVRTRAEPIPGFTGLAGTNGKWSH